MVAHCLPFGQPPPPPSLWEANVECSPLPFKARGCKATPVRPKSPSVTMPLAPFVVTTDMPWINHGEACGLIHMSIVIPTVCPTRARETCSLYCTPLPLQPPKKRN